MRQNLMPRRFRHSLALPYYSCEQRRGFILQVRLRGELGPVCERHGAGLEEAIHWGQAQFPAFTERNPWIGLDWLQGKIWILLILKLRACSHRPRDSQ